MKITHLVLLHIVALTWIASCNAASLYNFLPDIQIQSTAIADNYAKIETYSYVEPQAAKPTYIVCIMALTTQANGGQIYQEKRRYVVGETGSNGPDIIPITYLFDTGKVYKDIDLADGQGAECIFTALATDDNIYMGSGKAAYTQTTVGSRDQIEVLSDGSSNYIVSMNNWWWLPGIFGSPAVFSFGDSQDAIRLPSGAYAAIGAADADSTLSLRTTLGADNPILNAAGYTGNKPSLVGFNDDSVMACAQNPSKGIVCGSYPYNTGPDSTVARASTSTQTVTMPVLGRLSNDSDLVSVAALMYDTTFSQSYYEVSVMSRSSVIQLSVTKGGVYRVSQTAQDNYIFAVYAKSNGVFMDVIYYGDAQPPLAPPVAQPIAPPVDPPVDPPVTPPIDPPTTSPISSPVDAPQEAAPVSSTPVEDTPVDVPVAAPIAQNGTLGPVTAVGADVLGPAIAIPGAAVVGTGLFLLLFFRNKKKKEKDEEQSSDDSKANVNGSNQRFSVEPSNYGKIPGRASTSNGYGAIPHGSAESTGSNVDGWNGINPTAIKPSEVDKRMQIPYKSLFFAREIGAGSYGKVFQGEWRGAQVAIKVNNQISDTEGFLAEAKLTLGIAPHPNLVQTFGVSLDGPNPCIVLEYCGGGSLDSVMYDKDKIVTTEKKRDYALKIAYGLIHLHNNNIVHRDLAARNILLANDGTPKISDFGMSRIIQDEGSKGKTKATIGPLRWMAPESLLDRDYSVKSDVWSYGILVWEIVARKEPHEDEDQLMIGAKIRDSAYTPQIPSECDPTLKQVMEMCWKKDPAERPTMDQIIELLRSA